MCFRSLWYASRGWSSYNSIWQQCVYWYSNSIRRRGLSVFRLLFRHHSKRDNWNGHIVQVLFLPVFRDRLLLRHTDNSVPTIARNIADKLLVPYSSQNPFPVLHGRGCIHPEERIYDSKLAVRFQVTFFNRLIINYLHNCIAYNMPTFLIYYRLFLT